METKYFQDKAPEFKNSDGIYYKSFDKKDKLILNPI